MVGRCDERIGARLIILAALACSSLVACSGTSNVRGPLAPSLRNGASAPAVQPPTSAAVSTASGANCDLSRLSGVVTDVHRGTHSGEASARVDLSYDAPGECVFGEGMGVDLLVGDGWQPGKLEIPMPFVVPIGIPRVHLLSWTWAQAEGLTTVTATKLQLTLGGQVSPPMAGPGGSPFAMQVLLSDLLLNP